MIDIERLVREALQHHEAEVPMPDPLEAHPVAVRTRRRQVLNLLGAGVVALLIALGAAGGLGSLLRTDGRRPSMEPAPTPSRPFFLDLRTGARSLVPKTLVPQLAGFRVQVTYSASPDGTRLAYSSCINIACSGEDVMGIGSIDGTGARTLRVPAGLNGFLPRWSPDGSELVYQLRDGASDEIGNLFVQDVSSGRRTQLTDLGLTRAGSWFLAARFSPDGRNVIFHLPRGEGAVPVHGWDVWSVPVAGGEPTLVLRDAMFPEYFPGGEAIVFVEPSPGASTLQIADADGSTRSLAEASSPDGIWWPAISPDGTRIAYRDGGSIYVVDVATGASTWVADGDNAEWLGRETLIVAPIDAQESGG
jgi:Tol biopolymer transport system component